MTVLAKGSSNLPKAETEPDTPREEGGCNPIRANRNNVQERMNKTALLCNRM
jgi:hypothetical protein